MHEINPTNRAEIKNNESDTEDKCKDKTPYVAIKNSVSIPLSGVYSNMCPSSFLTNMNDDVNKDATNSIMTNDDKTKSPELDPLPTTSYIDSNTNTIFTQLSMPFIAKRRSLIRAKSTRKNKKEELSLSPEILKHSKHLPNIPSTQIKILNLTVHNQNSNQNQELTPMHFDMQSIRFYSEVESFFKDSYLMSMRSLEDKTPGIFKSIECDEEFVCQDKTITLAAILNKTQLTAKELLTHADWRLFLLVNNMITTETEYFHPMTETETFTLLVNNAKEKESCVLIPSSHWHYHEIALFALLKSNDFSYVFPGRTMKAVTELHENILLQTREQIVKFNKRIKEKKRIKE